MNLDFNKMNLYNIALMHVPYNIGFATLFTRNCVFYHSLFSVTKQPGLWPFMFYSWAIKHVTARNIRTFLPELPLSSCLKIQANPWSWSAQAQVLHHCGPSGNTVTARRNKVWVVYCELLMLFRSWNKTNHCTLNKSIQNNSHSIGPIV